MKTIKIILGTVVGLLALAGWFAVFKRLLHFGGSDYERGGLGGAVIISLLVTLGAIKLFQSAFKKTPPT